MIKPAAGVSFLTIVVVGTVTSASPQPQVQGSDALEYYMRGLIDGN